MHSFLRSLHNTINITLVVVLACYSANAASTEWIEVAHTENGDLVYFVDKDGISTITNKIKQISVKTAYSDARPLAGNKKSTTYDSSRDQWLVDCPENKRAIQKVSFFWHDSILDTFRSEDTRFVDVGSDSIVNKIVDFACERKKLDKNSNVQRAIDQRQLLKYWQDHDPEKWQMSIRFDAFLSGLEDYKNTSIEERFADVENLTAAYFTRKELLHKLK